MKKDPNTHELPKWAVLPIILVIALGFLFMPKMEHIEDVNGPEDFSLATLTEEDILADSLTCKGGPNKSVGRLYLPNGWTVSSGVELSSKQYSGVTDILWANYILPSDFHLMIEHFSVTEGNLRLMVINEGEIIADVEPGDSINLLLNDLTGYTTLRIAGESAAYTIIMTETEYDFFDHP